MFPNLVGPGYEPLLFLEIKFGYVQKNTYKQKRLRFTSLSSRILYLILYIAFFAVFNMVVTEAQHNEQIDLMKKQIATTQQQHKEQMDAIRQQYESTFNEMEKAHNGHMDNLVESLDRSLKAQSDKFNDVAGRLKTAFADLVDKLDEVNEKMSNDLRQMDKFVQEEVSLINMRMKRLHYWWIN